MDSVSLSNGPGPMDFFNGRFRELQQQQVASQDLIKDLLIYCEQLENTLHEEMQKLTTELRDCRLDLDDATKSRRKMQQQLADYDTQFDRFYKENDGLKNRNPYVMLLIDGDGLLFQDRYVKQGIEGGKSAAYALRSAIAEQCGERADEVEIIAKVVANVSGLSKAMARDGCIDNPSELREFALGFTQAKASFDFIDVGHGKERADSKIKETTRWHLRNHNCKQILLGISHDAAYAPFLDDILQDGSTRERVTLLEGYPTVQDIVSTNIAVLKLENDLFRTDKLINRSFQFGASTRPAANTAPAAVTSPNGGVVVEPKPSSTPPVSSWAGVTKNASPPPQITLPLQPKSTNGTSSRASSSAAKQSAWNPGPRGLDKAIPVNPAVYDMIKKRKDYDKLCNRHFLMGQCFKGSDCSFVHDYEPDQQELNAIAVLTRQNPCTLGQLCDDDNCMYGHHCPSVIAGVCQHPHCRYDDDAHPPGTKLKRTTSHR